MAIAGGNVALLAVQMCGGCLFVPAAQHAMRVAASFTTNTISSSGTLL